MNDPSIAQKRAAVEDHLAAIATWTVLGNLELVAAHRAAVRLVLRAMEPLREEAT